MEVPLPERLLPRPRQDRDLGLAEMKVGNSRVAVYNEELALAICERLSFGETLKHICESEGMPSRSTVHRWVINYPKFGDAYNAARELSAYALEDEAMEAARLIRSQHESNSAKVRAYDIAIQQFRWSAARRNPRVFSERSAVLVTVPIQINTSLNLDSGAPVDQSASSDPNAIYTIEATVNKEINPDVEPEDKNPFVSPKTSGTKAKPPRPPRKRGVYG